MILPLAVAKHWILIVHSRARMGCLYHSVAVRHLVLLLLRILHQLHVQILTIQEVVDDLCALVHLARTDSTLR